MEEWKFIAVYGWWSIYQRPDGTYVYVDDDEDVETY